MNEYLVLKESSMEDTKKWYMSKSVWGGMIAVAAAVAGAFGFSIGAEEQSILAESAVAVAGIVGAVVAVVGRVKASKKIE